MKLLIFYLTDDRRHYTFPHFINMINNSEKKILWKLLILTHSEDSDFYSKFLKNFDINHEIIKVDHYNNYLKKVHYASNYANINNIPYVMKCDNDIFIKAQTLDYMIDNLHLLENSKNLTLSPTLTSGIPGIEYFKESFLDEDANKYINNLFLKTQFYDRDGANYKHLNKHTLDTFKWDKEQFFNSVKTMDHHYKGIHPIRINEESLQFLNTYIINNKDRFMENHNLDIITDNNSPYLCNSIFCIKTNTYISIISNLNLYVDSFDEVPLNKYAWQNNMSHLFVKNGYAIHMYYNWNSKHILYEQNFCEIFFSK